jgi:hypothetical protein
MTKFKIGEKIIVYNGKRHVGVVVDSSPNLVKIDTSSTSRSTKIQLWVHPKQCRHIKKKPDNSRRSVWLCPKNLEHAEMCICSLRPVGGYVEFIEVV